MKGPWCMSAGPSANFVNLKQYKACMHGVKMLLDGSSLGWKLLLNKPMEGKSWLSEPIRILALCLISGLQEWVQGWDHHIMIGTSVFVYLIALGLHRSPSVICYIFEYLFYVHRLEPCFVLKHPSLWNIPSQEMNLKPSCWFWAATDAHPPPRQNMVSSLQGLNLRCNPSASLLLKFWRANFRV